MPTHECCCLITIPDGKTAEGDAFAAECNRLPAQGPPSGGNHHPLIIVDMNTKNVCVQVYMNAIICIWQGVCFPLFFPPCSQRAYLIYRN